uniref:Type III effector n=1 Tax=Haptolina brevifila TaxID=156173 RepID=A0A7S2NN87_9EUKA|mmetsp:Transcript_8502/g.17224  ORF Transcript_8502/g.17224 Transcript_8502/m.17224 type:complete len:178 (+) Transcript_8502:44-577(+)
MLALSIVHVSLGLHVLPNVGFSVPLVARQQQCRTNTVRLEDEVSDWGVDNLFDMMEEADVKIGNLEAFMKTVRSDAKSIEFEVTMAAIEEGYDYVPTAFSCGAVESSSAQNQGSAKIFSFAKLQKLNKETTLNLFGRFYRDDVLGNPDGDDHGNIRNFMATGWDGVSFPNGVALKKK